MPPLDMLNAVYTPVCIVYGVYAPLGNIVCCIPIFSCVYSDFAKNIVTIGLGKVLKQLWRCIFSRPSAGNEYHPNLCHLSQLSSLLGPFNLTLSINFKAHVYSFLGSFWYFRCVNAEFKGPGLRNDLSYGRWYKRSYLWYKACLNCQTLTNSA